MFIQTEPTPNPNVLKFLPGRDVSEDPRDFVNADEAAASPLAEALFQLDGVTSVFFGYDYVSVTREAQGLEWNQMKAPILAAIMDHFVSGAPLMRGGAFN
ncbi:MAG: NifU N-terminal domain-containing protein, partial [Brevundimonas sp.]|nr:NifU N-terminal domain-containing protein [Brevundimonas sp.]